MAPLTGQVALVTGAGSGIGRAVALALAAHGAALWLVGRRQEALEATAEQAASTGSEIRVCSLDVTTDDEIEALGTRVREAEGRLDLLVHCAGAISLGRIDEAAVHDLDVQYRANVRAPYLLTQTVLPMLKAHGGQVVFVNSSVFNHARANVGQFAATQYALKAVADSLRDEVNEAGVRVLSVFPGRTATPRQAALHELEGKSYLPERLMAPEDVASMVLSAVTLPPRAEVTEIGMRPSAKPPG